ncbi:MAG: adenylate/guanylate cyclase domain-containing protein, partial [Chloroflexi bacterium]|nr:adenylate/guanylate cyclase domain-containing protein [Chloroflexota bacterium]
MRTFWTFWRVVFRFIFTPQRPLRRLGSGLAVGVIVGAIMAFGVWLGLFHDIRLRLQDVLYTPRPTQGQFEIVIVAIDDVTVGAYGSWPIDRGHYTELVDKLSSVGAGVVAFDILFADPGDPTTDAELAGMMDLACNVVQPVAGTNKNFTTTEVGELITYDAFEYPIPELRETCTYYPRTSLGHSNVVPDGDGFVRRVPLVVVDEDMQMPSLSMATYMDPLLLTMDEIVIDDNEITFEREGSPVLPTDDNGQMLIYYFGPPSHANEPGSTFPVYSLVDVLENMDDEQLAATFGGKYVLVGVLDLTAQPDNYGTPSTDTGEKMYGVEIHANVLETIIQSSAAFEGEQEVELDLLLFKLKIGEIERQFPLREQSTTDSMLTTFLIALLAGALLPFFRWYIGGPLVVLGYWFGYYLWATYSFTVRAVVIDLAFPGAAMLFTYMGTVIVVYVFAERRRGQINDLFSRYVSAEIAQKIVEAFDQGRLELGGEEREITVLFADIRGFTPMLEALSPTEAVTMLNFFLEEMNAIVMRYGGAINKYIGDNLMAFWNAPYPQQDHAWLATQAGLEMLESITRLNASGRFSTPVQFGIGINTGPVVVGNIGSQKRLEYTPIGDTVNVASRLSGVAPGGTCFIGARTYDLVADRVSPASEQHVTLKGKSRPVHIYELLPRGDAIPATTTPPDDSTALVVSPPAEVTPADATRRARRRRAALLAPVVAGGVTAA